MVKQSHSEIAKLSLVGQHSTAVDFAVADRTDSELKDIAQRLPAVLQTTLELEEVITLFHREISKVITYDSLHYLHQDMLCDISTASHSHHKCTYRLEMNTVWLGELTLTRSKKFSDIDTQLIEELLCKLIYPLRNCLLYRQARNSALQDKLTGLHNRTAFDESLKREIGLASRQQIPLSLIVLDIDNFKTINDTYGHNAGDTALQMLATTIIETMRSSDIVFRYGGEEFTLILSNADKKAAQLVAERIRVATSQLSCNDGKRTFGFTVSLGVAQFKQGETASNLFDRADGAVYQAKKAGRNTAITTD